MNRTRIRAAVALAALLTLVMCFSSNAQTDMPELYSKLSTAIVSPHISWAKPYYKGPLRALVIAPRWRQRDTVELMERLDVQCTPVFVYSDTDLYLGGWNWGFEKMKVLQKDAVLKSLDDALKDNYDVIILAYSPVEKFPQSAIDAIVAKVSSGTGIVYIYWNTPRPDNALVKTLTQTPLLGAEQAAISGIPIEFLQLRNDVGTIQDRAKEMKSYLSFYQYNKGKVALVSLDSRFFLAHSSSDDLTYEYYAAYMINVILKAAGKESGIQYPGYQPSLNAKAGQPINYTLKLENSNAPVQATVTAFVRTSMELLTPKQPKPNQGISDTAASVLAPVWQDKKTVSLPTGASEISFTIPGFSSGDYFMDVQIASAQKNMSWSAEKITVQPDVSVTDVKVTPSTLDMNEPGRQVQVQATLNSPAPAGVSLSVTLLDNNDRVLDVKTAALKEGDTTAQFSLSAEGILSTLSKVRVALVKGDVTLSVNIGYFTVYHRSWPDFTFFAWGPGEPGTYEDRLMKKLVVSLGVDAFRGGNSIESLKVADVRCITDVTRLSASISDLQPRMEIAKSITKVVKGVRPFDPFGFLYGDDFGCLTNSSQLTNYGEFLKQKYHTIDSLNAQWGFQYTSFDDVMAIMTGPDVDKANAAQNYSYMIDQWLYKYFIFADTIRFLGKTIKEIDPAYKVGGSTPLWNYWYRGYDWAHIMPYFDIFTPYYGGDRGDSHYEVGRSFAKRGTVLSGHYGSYAATMWNEPYYTFVPWSLLLHGASNAFWYNFGFGDESGFSPSLDLYPCLQRSSDEINAIKNGPGTLLLGAKRISDGIAIHYSPANLIYSSMVSGPVVSWNYNALIRAIKDMGFQADFVSDDQIRNGKLSEYKVLFLPISQCIGQQEAQKMKEFVENGGLLIANIRPGIADDHGKVGNQKIIPQLFGVQWKNVTQPIGTMNVQLSGSYKGKTFLGPEEEINVDTAMYLDGAQAVLTVNGTPLFTYKGSGKGTAICLNTQNYPSWSPASPSAPNIITELLAAHNIEPVFHITKTQGKYDPAKWIPGFDSLHFSDGKALYFGITREGYQNDNDKVVGTFTLAFPEKGYLYDMRKKKYLGYVDSWTADIGPYGLAIYSLLPYKVEGIDIKTGKQEYSRGDMVAGEVSVNTGGNQPVRHVINLSVTRPDGMEVSYFRQNLETVAGKTSFQFPLALNEPTGAWQIKFTDAATGVSGSLAVNVR